MQLKKVQIIAKKTACQRFGDRNGELQLWQVWRTLTDRQTDRRSHLLSTNTNISKTSITAFSGNICTAMLWMNTVYAGESLYNVVSPVEQQQTNWSLGGGRGGGRTHHLPSTTTLCSEWPLKSPKRDVCCYSPVLNPLCWELLSLPPPSPSFRLSGGVTEPCSQSLSPPPSSGRVSLCIVSCSAPSPSPHTHVSHTGTGLVSS